MRNKWIAGLALLVLASIASAYQAKDDEVILEKKESLTAKDPAYKLDPKADKDKFALLAEHVDGNPHKVYTIKLDKGQKLVITLEKVGGGQYDPVVIVENADKKPLAFNDDDEEAGTQNSRLVWTVPEKGEYRIIASSYEKDEVGDFWLKVTRSK